MEPANLSLGAPLSKGNMVDLHVVGYVWSDSAKQLFATTRVPEAPMKVALDGSSLTRGLYEALLGLRVGSRAVVTYVITCGHHSSHQGPLHSSGVSSLQ